MVSINHKQYRNWQVISDGKAFFCRSTYTVSQKMKLLSPLLLVLLCLTTGLHAQPQPRQAAPPVMRVILPAGESQAYIYHTLTPPPGHGVMLYRQVDGRPADTLTAGPLLVSFDPATIADRAGLAYPTLLQATGRQDALSAIIALRQDPFTANLLTFLSPGIAEVLGRRLVDPDPPAGALVTYRVEVVNDLGEPIGEQIEHTLTLSPVNPEPPSGLELENLGHVIRLRWDYRRADPNQDDAVVAFQASCLVSSEGTGDAQSGEPRELTPEPALRTLNTTEFSTSVPAPQPGSGISCAVAPVTFAGTMGRVTPQVSLQVLNIEPLPVVGVPELQQVGGYGVRVAWAGPADERVRGYNLYRAELATDGFVRVNRELLPPERTVFDDRAPRDGMPWFYRVAVVGPDGREGELSPPEFVFVYDVTPPSAPRDFRAEARDDGTVLLTWQDPTPAPDLWTYVVLRRRDNPIAGPAWTQINHGNELRTTRFLDDGEARRGFYEGDFYGYALVAVDSARNRSDTLYARVQIPDLTPPEAPSALRAGLADGFRVNLNWNASPDGDVVEYVVYRAEAPAGPATESQDTPARTQARFTERTRVDRSLQFLRDEQVQPGLSYTYRVTAVDSAGNESTPSPVAEILVRPADPPANVRNTRVEATPDGTGTEVIWEPVRSPHLAGYRIYRSDLSTGVYEPAGETGPGQTRWTDPAAAGQRWWYKVYAVDVAGVQSRLAEPARLIR